MSEDEPAGAGTVTDADNDEIRNAPAAKERSTPVKFVVLSMPRTGSTMVTDWLATHNAVRCLPAIFSEAGWPKRASKGNAATSTGWMRRTLGPDWDDLDRRLAKPMKLLREIIEKSPDKTAVGFKHHIFTNEMTDYLLASGLRKIVLTRKNLLAAYSSHKIAGITGQGSARSGEKVIQAKAEFDADEFEKFCEKRDRLYAYVRERAKRQCMEIDYTVARTPDGLASIGRFLRIDPQGFGAPQTVKRSSDDIVSRFANSEAVLSHLQKTGKESWATEN
jgi:hypothetical protein